MAGCQFCLWEKNIAPLPLPPERNSGHPYEREELLPHIRCAKKDAKNQVLPLFDPSWSPLPIKMIAPLHGTKRHDKIIYGSEKSTQVTH